MAKKTRNALPPVSLGVFRQMVYDCGAEMMSAGFNKDEIICRLMTLADYPITSEKQSRKKMQKVVK